MLSPLVSVIIPAFNAQDTVGRAIESVLHQTYDNIEIIAVNDGSTDETGSVIENYPEVRQIHQQNRGPNPARSAGLDAASGDLIAMLDADDEYHKMKIELQVRILETAPNISAIFCADCIVKDGVRFCHPRDVSGRVLIETLPRMLSGKRHGHSVSVVMRRKLIEHAGGLYRPGMETGERDLWLRALSKGHILCTVKLPLYYYHKMEGSLSTQLAAQFERELRYLNAWFPGKTGMEFSPSREVFNTAWATSMSRCVNRFVKYNDIDNAKQAWRLLKERGKPSLKTRAVITWPEAARFFALMRNRLQMRLGATIYRRWAEKMAQKPSRIHER